MLLPVASIKVDPHLQLRDGLDMDRVAAMREFIEYGGTLPPITVVGADNLLADGHHRLYVAEKEGQQTIRAERLPGGPDEAVVIAIARNDISTAKPLTRTERNKGVKLLLQAGWTQERIAKATGVSQRTISDIANALAMRGQITKPQRNATKRVAVLPERVHERLNDTTLVRIADSVPVEQQREFAEAVVEAALPEPRVREAIKTLREGYTPTEAVDLHRRSVLARPVGLADVAKQARHRLERFLAEPMTVEGQPRDFWQVLEVIGNHAEAVPMEARALGSLLAEVSVKADAYASLLNTNSGRALGVREVEV